MQIKVTYDKTTNTINVSSDIEDIVPLELNQNSVINTETELSFEIAVDTTSYEKSQQDSGEINFEEIE